MPTPRPLNVKTLVSMLPRTGTVLVGGCSASSNLLADMVDLGGEALGDLIFTGIMVPGLNRRIWRPNARCRFETFFMTPELKAVGTGVTLLPLTYTEIRARWLRSPPDAALFSVTPPDAEGICSFGPTVDFLAELWPMIPIRIAHINPTLPRTGGTYGIPLDMIHVAIEAPEQPPTLSADTSDPVTQAIAAHVAAFIGDDATLQTGVGKLPGAILHALRSRRRLRIHSGLIGDAVLDLAEAGALGSDRCVCTGVAIGSQRLYAALPGRDFRFAAVSHTHAPDVLAAQRNPIAINAALSVDLFGQGYAEVGPEGWFSGTGGATDFARGAKAAGGLRIVALPATVKGASRIGAAAGPITLSRTDVDIVATEHGAADIRGLTHEARADALIGIAAPEHREELVRAWRAGPGRY